MASAPTGGSQKVASGIFASRIVGLLREIALGSILGTGAAGDAFRIAMRVPNMLQNLLGEGSISAAFVPVYAGLVEQGKEDEARTVARQALGLLAAVVPALVALIVIFARPLVWLTTIGGVTGARFELAVSLTRFTALGVGFLVLSAWCLGVLNAHRHYLLSYSAPVLWSLFQVGALAAAYIADIELERVARWTAIGMILGSIAQFAVQLPAVRRVSGSTTPLFGIGADLRIVLRRFGPALGGRGVVQISSFVDLMLASLLVVGAHSVLGLVAPLYILSISVFGFSVAVSELTEMSRTEGGHEAVATRVRLAVRRVLLPAGLVTAGAVGGGTIIIGSLYERIASIMGRTGFTSASTMVAGATLAAFGLGLPAAMTARVTQNTLYALGDVRGPARIAVVRLAVGALVGFVLMIQLDHLAADPLPDRQVYPTADTTTGPFGTVAVENFPHWPPWEPVQSDTRETSPYTHFGPVGLGLGAAVASWVEWLLLRQRLSRHLLGYSITTGLGRWVAVAGFAAFVAARGVAAIGLPQIIDLLVLGGVVAGTYFGVLWFVGLRPRTTPP